MDEWFASTVMIFDSLPCGPGRRGLTSGQIRNRLAANGIAVHEDSVQRRLQNLVKLLPIEADQDDKGRYLWRRSRRVSFGHLVCVEDYVGEPLDIDSYGDNPEPLDAAIPDFPSDIILY